MCVMPARLSFHRTPATETRASLEALAVLALAGPEVAFTRWRDARALLDVPRVDRRIDRVHGLWGRELADTLLPVELREAALEVTGFAQRPSEAKPAGRKGYVFVRGRPIKDPFIVRAAEAGYRSTVAPGDRPSLLLFVDLPGDAVDVNVHPAKLEARFRDKFFVEQMVQEAVRRSLVPLEAAAPIGGSGGDMGPWQGIGAELGGGVPLERVPGNGRAACATRGAELLPAVAPLL